MDKLPGYLFSFIPYTTSFLASFQQEVTFAIIGLSCAQRMELFTVVEERKKVALQINWKFIETGNGDILQIGTIRKISYHEIYNESSFQGKFAHECKLRDCSWRSFVFQLWSKQLSIQYRKRNLEIRRQRCNYCEFLKKYYFFSMLQSRLFDTWKEKSGLFRVFTGRDANLLA